MTASQFILDPLRGKISLWRVTWLYCLVPGAILQVFGELVAGAGDAAMRAFGLLALLYATYVAVATYRCAGNCPWPWVGDYVRFCVLVSLVTVLPLMAYLILSGTPLTFG